MLKLASLCFPDDQKSCFYCCPPIRDPEADPLDNIEERRARLRLNRKNLKKNIARGEEISGESCWGLGFLDDEEKQAGCLLHPLRHDGDDLRHLTGYQFKCANALCREALIFSELTPDEQNFCLDPCRGMDSFTYSSRSNPLMRLLAWETKMVRLIVADARENDKPFPAAYKFLWQKLDFRLDGYLAYESARRKGIDYLRRNLKSYISQRDVLIDELKKIAADHDLRASADQNLIPVHRLKIPLTLSRLLKFGAGLWELPDTSSELLLNKTEQTLEKILLS
jgi:hypothetical protein